MNTSPTTTTLKKGRSEVREASLQEQIARRAHELWEQEGRPPGRDREHWLAAEEQILGLANPGVESATPWGSSVAERKR